MRSSWARPTIVEVRAVDNFFNIVTTTNPVITLTSDDPNAVSPSTDSPKIMSSGVVFLPFMLKTSEVYPNGIKTTLLTASAAGFNTGAPYQSGGLVMAPTTYNNVQILVPPQAGAPGTATGKTVVTITTQTAGISFNPIVRAVDRYFNITNTAPTGLALIGTDPHDKSSCGSGLSSGSARAFRSRPAH